MIKACLLCVACSYGINVAATSLWDRVAPLTPGASATFRNSAETLDHVVRTLELGHQWGREDELALSYAAFVYNLRRHTGDRAVRRRAVEAFATYCRDEVPGSVTALIDLLTSVERHARVGQGAIDLPPRPVDLRLVDLVIGPLQALTGLALSTVSATLLPLLVVSPILNALGGQTVTMVDGTAIDAVGGWFLASLRFTADGFGRMIGQSSAKRLITAVHPRALLVEQTCAALLNN